MFLADPPLQHSPTLLDILKKPERLVWKRLRRNADGAVVRNLPPPRPGYSRAGFVNPLIPHPP